MATTTRSRIGIGAGVAVLCLGLATPASAHDEAASAAQPATQVATNHGQFDRFLLIQRQAALVAFLDTEATLLTQARARLMTGPGVDNAPSAPRTVEHAVKHRATDARKPAATVAKVTDTRAHRSTNRTVTVPVVADPNQADGSGACAGRHHDGAEHVANRSDGRHKHADGSHDGSTRADGNHGGGNHDSGQHDSGQHDGRSGSSHGFHG